VNPAIGRVPAMTTNTPASAETTRALQHRFPWASVWQGKTTGHWWAYIPVGPRGRLLEAAHPAELAHRLKSAARDAHPAARPQPDQPPARASRATALARITAGLMRPDSGGGR
jgi:hypothetical protein